MQSEKTKEKSTSNIKPEIGLVVDGWCSGNPGKGGYKGIDLRSGKKIFEVTFALCTNNIVEYCAAVHGLMHCKKRMINYIVYTDSTTVINWVNIKKGSNTTGPYSDIAKEYLQRCDLWLMEQKTYNTVNKWLTKKWGENPADFGNKK